MTLESYTHGRLVTMLADTAAYDAVRALEDNHIGVVIVREEGRVVGVVTDRDLARQVISLKMVAGFDRIEMPSC